MTKPLYSMLALTLISFVLTACGGGGDSSPAVPAPSGLSYSSPQVLTTGVALPALSPTVTGTVTSYAVSPALPAGLSLNTTSGVISGTPTAPTAAATYVVTGSAASGSTTTNLSITVNDPAPNIGYGSNTFRLTTGLAIHELTPNSTGGTAVTWSVSPALPAGLTLVAETGHITGTPTQVAATADYVVTATNTGGQSQAVLSIGVESGVLVELGHTTSVFRARLVDSRALTQESNGHWVLWDYATGGILAVGDTPCTEGCVGRPLPVELKGTTLVAQPAAGTLEIRHASDGSVVSTINREISWWTLAADGSYVAAGNSSGLSVWSSSGSVLVTRSGDYSTAFSFAAAQELRIAGGAAGANVVETIVLPAGTVSVSGPFSGQFSSWFTDGERFATTLANTLILYSKTAVQQYISSTVGFSGGTGDWFWDAGINSVNLYAVAGGSTPAATYNFGFAYVISSGGTLAITSSNNSQLAVIDLSTLTRTDYVLPLTPLSSYSRDASGDFLLGFNAGAVLDGASLGGTLRYLAVGAALDIAGSSERVAISTGSGTVLYFNASTKALEGKISFRATPIALSSDGSVLAVGTNAGGAGQPSVGIYSLPAGTQTYAWNDLTFRTMSLSASGQTLLRMVSAGGLSTRREVTPATGGPVIWSDTLLSANVQPVRLSPDGSRIAAATLVPSEAGGASNIITNGVLNAAIPAWAVGWIDDHHLLANTFTPNSILGYRYDGAVIYDDTGVKLTSPTLPELHTIQPLTSDSIYSPELNVILSLTTGSTLWSSSNSTRGQGAVAGERVVFASGAQVRVEPR